MMINLEQVRAHRAFEKATAIAEQGLQDEAGKVCRQDFLSLTRNLPAMFQNNGLLATWAFLLSKKSEAHRETLQIMLAHFCDDQLALDVTNSDSARVFAEEWTNPSQPLTGASLMRITAEAVAFSGWLKRAAEALCDD